MATLLSIKKQTLLLLGQEYDSDAASLPSGAGGADTIDSGDQITAWINEGAAILSRSCLPLPARASFSLSSGVNSTRLNAFAMEDMALYARLWAVRSAVISGSALEHIQRAVLENHFPLWSSETGTPLYWFEDGETQIGIYPALATGTPSLIAAGFATPAPLADDGDAFPWLSEDIARLLSYYTAAQIGLKNFENADLFGRSGIWLGKWDTERLLLWEQIDTRTREAHFPVAPGTTGTGK